MNFVIFRVWYKKSEDQGLEGEERCVYYHRKAGRQFKLHIRANWLLAANSLPIQIRIGG